MEHKAPLSNDYFAAVYACVSILILMLLALLIYVTCSRKFKLNWYEKTQLEANEKNGQGPFSSVATGRTAADCASGDATTVSSRHGNLSRFLRSQSSGKLDSPSSSSREFWVPISVQRQASFCQSDGPNECSGEDSVPDTPNTPLGIKVSPFALSHMSQPERGTSPLVKPVQPASSQVPRPKFATMYAKLDHTKIDAAMYQQQKQEISEPQDEEDEGGSMCFAATYTPQFSLLCVHIIKARNLVAKDISGTADPYAKIRLLPDTTTSRESSTQWKTLNPVFDEEVVFDIPQSELNFRVLEILLFDYDHYSRHQCLGRVEVPLSQLNLNDNLSLWKGICFCDEKDDKPELGDLMFSLGYLQSAERLTVVVLKARNLRTLDETKAAFDPYVKVIIFQGGRRIKKKKTSVQKATVNPLFNEALSFNSISKDMLKNLTMEISVMHENILGQNATLGTVVIGPHSKGQEAAHRRNVLGSKPALAMWHTLTLTGNLTNTLQLQE